MLASLRRAARPVALRARTLCAPAAAPPVLTEIREAIADMKEKAEAKPAEGSAYTASSFQAALGSGKVDISLLSTTLGSFDISARKLALKCVADSATMTREKAEEEAVMAAYDWSTWEKKGLDASVVAEVKAIMAEGLAKEKTLMPELIKENKLDELQKEITDAFKGPGGFLELAAAEEKAAKAGMLACLADMEKLELDAVGIREVTIAEILEREPELRAEIEEEIKNNNWGY
jgi:hypothetical protein